MREGLPPDFAFDDHRTLGMETLARDKTVASLSTRLKLDRPGCGRAPQPRLEPTPPRCHDPHERVVRAGGP
jgi:hypothetical protein